MDDKTASIFHDETQSERFIRKTKDSPYFVIGMIAMLTTAGIGIYRFKNRGKVDAGLYLMKLRVAAQGTAVATITIGMVHNMYTTYMEKQKKKSEV